MTRAARVPKSAPAHALSPLALDYSVSTFEGTLAVNADCFEWMQRIPRHSIHAIVTDPPYGLEEYEVHQLERLHNGNIGGIWRIPPSFDGHKRAPLPRFTALNTKQRASLREFFTNWSRLVAQVVRPGGHVLVAGNAFLSQFVWSAIVDGGLEFRGELIRLVRTLRGGDKPKNAHEEFPEVCSLPRGCYEPWGVFRAPLPKGAKVSDCLREYGTGGLRSLPDGRPFADVLPSERTPRRERSVAPHPSLKPQSLLRQLVYAALPLGHGIVADPFMGSGSTLAAAAAMGIECVGTERFKEYFAIAPKSIRALAGMSMDLANGASENLSLELI